MGPCYLGWELWRRLKLDEFFPRRLDHEAADVAWSQVAAVLAINRCAPREVSWAFEQRRYPSTALGDVLQIEEGKINDTRLYRCLDRLLPLKGHWNNTSSNTMESCLGGVRCDAL